MEDSRVRSKEGTGERVYEVSGDAAVLVGIPDVSVQKVHPSDLPSTQPMANLMVADSEVQPVEVTLPLSETYTEGYLEIRAVDTGDVITAIEVLSPKNKQIGVGRLQYETKRQKTLGSATHLVEIDLLRKGKPMPIVGDQPQSHYRILVSRSENRPQAKLYSFMLQNPIPVFSIPLLVNAPEPTVKLQTLIDAIYDQGSYDLRVDYNEPPNPPLSEAEMAWLKEKVKETILP